MMDKKLAEMINDQENFEWYSAYIYLGIANYYAGQNLNGFTNWFNVQAQEERDHATLFNKYLLNNGEAVLLKDIKAPEFSYDDFAKPMKVALAHEQKVTARINEICAHAFGLKDFRTMQFLNWFVAEQGEEEKDTEELLMRYGLFANDSRGLYLLDAELLRREYVPPTMAL